jgi:hypothetical protein
VGSYELRAGDSGAASDLEIDRTEWSVVAGRGIVRGRLSWVSAAEWNRSGVRTDRAVVESVEADSDGGFELAVEVERMFVRRGPWAAGAYGEAAYRRENYSLSYGESLVREVVVVDTNGVPGVETVNELRPREERWTLTETTVRAGGVVSYSDRGWTGYARLGADLLSDAGSSGALVQGERRVALEPRRKQNVFVAAGADLRLESGLNFFAEIETLGSEARRFGISYEF